MSFVIISRSSSQNEGTSETDISSNETSFKEKQQPQEEEKIQLREAILSDFQDIENIGVGSYGKVRLVQKDGKRFAMKELSKEQILRLGKTESVFRERDFLNMLKHPAVPKLYFTFQDEQSLYFIMEHVPNGSLSQLLEQSGGTLPSNLAKFYAAWLVISLEYLHSEHVIHRDLKPQNILIDEKYYLKIIDYGDSKKISEEDFQEEQKMFSEARLSAASFSSLFKASEVQSKPREGTFVGTPLFVAPEMLEFNMAGNFTDLWALGCIIYQFLEGTTPFHGKNSDEVFQNILERNLHFPNHMDRDAADLIDKLLDYTPENRIGMRGYNEIKSHPYFKDINFDVLSERKYKVPAEDIFNQKAFITEDSDDELDKMKKIENSKCNIDKDYRKFDRKQFDKCCYKKIDLNKLVMEGIVKVRRKLFFYKNRYLVLLEDGSVFLTKHRHIKCQIIMDKTTKITLDKHERFQIQTKDIHEIIESPEAEIWVSILNSIKALNYPQTTCISKHK